MAHRKESVPSPRGISQRVTFGPLVRCASPLYSDMPWWLCSEDLFSTFKMDLDIQCEEMNPSRWAELLSTMKSCSTIRLDDCNLSSSNCKDLSSIIHTNPSLKELKLNNNELGDAGIEYLCKGLLTPSCSLQKLWLQNCNLTSASCETLRSVLSAQPSLTELHVGDNKLGTTGVKVLCQGLMNPNCKLQKLQLEYCELTADIVEALNAALQAKPTLKELSLSNNTLGDTAVKQLCRGLVEASCDLELLHLENCGITSDSCRDISAVLSSKPSLLDLAVGDNKIGDTGLALLCQGLLHPNCKIQKLWLWDCDLTSASCKDLSRVFSTKETLLEVSLIDNNLRDSGMEMLCQALKDPKAHLQELWVRECGLTAACCKAVSSVLSVNKHLQVLHIGENKLGNAGVEILCEGLLHPNCNIHSLWLGNCDITAACCATLANVMVTKQNLTELDLSYNTLEDEGVMKLCEAVRNPNCKMQQLILYDIFWGPEVDDELKALEEARPDVKIIS
ncbi:ribonuclease inhibitor isoform X3 [Gallus gallus]|uniref:ribonuclease inhibitor isoform X3 n=1 Tax=Gallus gallus TaxID=9031 RepID=UPI001F025C8B|nr:ribonuclease inhibitor isoform X3 [Gallus gallus]